MLNADVFPHSLGAYGGEPEHVVLEFAPRIAPYVRERLWHSSQRLMEQPDGSIQLSLDVGNDWALRSWILSFGPQVRVVSPSRLAQDILDEIEEARTVYAPRMEFEVPFSAAGSALQPILPMGGV